VRYRLEAVRDAGLCHCKTCRRGTGSAFSAWVDGDLELTSGTPRRWGSRLFCEACGTALGHEAGRVLAGTLDDPAAVAPRVHLAAAEQVPWLRLADLLPWTAAAEPMPEGERTIRRGPADPSVGRDAPLALREIDKQNLRAVLFMDVAGHQRRMVASNAISLAQAAFTPRSWARALCAGEVPVGFVMLELLEEDFEGLPMTGEPYLWRFMIDERYQGLGFGRRALELAAEAGRTLLPAARAFWLSCVRGPGAPYEFYRRAGFVDTGKREEEEHILMRPYDAGGERGASGAPR
jgi:diamine N-acetyltransferase